MNLYDQLQTLKLERSRLGKEFSRKLLDELSFSERKNRSNSIKRYDIAIDELEKKVRERCEVYEPEMV